MEERIKELEQAREASRVRAAFYSYLDDNDIDALNGSIKETRALRQACEELRSERLKNV